MKGLRKIVSLIVIVAMTVTLFPTALSADGSGDSNVMSEISVIPGKNNTYSVFGKTVTSNKMTFIDGRDSNITDPKDPLYSEDFEMDGITGRKVYKENYVYFKIDKTQINPDDHRFLIMITYYDFGPQVGYFYVDYNSNDPQLSEEARKYKRFTITKPGITPKWTTVRTLIDDADFKGSMEYGADLRIVTRNYNAFAKVELVNIADLESGDTEIEMPTVNTIQAEALTLAGLYEDKDPEGNPYGLEENMTRMQVLRALVKYLGKTQEDINSAKPSAVYSDVSGEDAKVITIAQDMGILKGTGSGQFAPERLATTQELLTFLLRYSGVNESDVYEKAYEYGSIHGLVKTDDFILFPTRPLLRDNFAAVAYNMLTASVKGGVPLIAKHLESGVVTTEDLAKTGDPLLSGYLYYMPVKVPKTEIYDSITGRTYYYANFNGDKMIRPYVTAQSWNHDGTKFIFSNDKTDSMYEYDIVTETVKYLDSVVKSSEALNAVVTPDDHIVYYDGSGTLWSMDWKTYTKKKLNSAAVFSIISITNDGRYLSGYNAGKYSRMDTQTGELLARSINFRDYNPESAGVGHPIINPEYENLVFFCNEGTTTLIPDRLWLWNIETDEVYNSFVQAENAGGTTGECSGHEVWNMNGEMMYWIKYTQAQNVGQSGFMRMDKYGKTREYINGDYPVWHCFPSGDDNWVAGDTNGGQIILANTNTYESYYIAKFRMWSATHPYQPHPHINFGSTVVSWQMVDDDNMLGVGWADISDLTQNPAVTKEVVLNDNLTVLANEHSKDFNIVPEAVYEGEECISAPMNNNIYLKINDDKILSEDGNFKLRLTYLDRGRQPVNIKYTASPTSLKELAFRENKTITLEKSNSGKWKTVELEINNANLNNACKHQSDMVIYSPYSQLMIKDVEIVEISDNKGEAKNITDELRLAKNRREFVTY